MPHRQTKSPAIAIGCVTDTKGSFVEQAARLLLSLRWFGGSVANCPFILAVVGELDVEQKNFFKRHGAEVVGVEPFDERHGPSNKLRFFELALLDQFTHIVLLDCDTIIVQDPAQWLKFEGFAAKPADLPTVSVEALSAYLEARNLEAPLLEFHHDVADVPALPYFNSGAIVLNARWRLPFIEAWKKYDRDLVERADQFDIHPFHVDQASLSAALLDIGIQIEALPSCMNLPAHLAPEQYNHKLFNIDPVVIHYHWLTDSNGYVTGLPLPQAQLRADMFNTRLRAERGKQQPRLPTRGANKPKIIVASGWWSSNEKSEWSIGSDEIRAPTFFHLWYGQVMKCLNPERIVVTDSHSPDKPDWQQYSNIVWVELDKNYGHPNDLRIGKIKTKYSGYTRSVLNGAMYAYCCDADYFVYVEQDCIVRGDGLLEKAVGKNSEGILLGARTEGGVGIEGGQAAPMLQNSLIIVNHDALGRFISSLLSSPQGDGERSIEILMEEHCAPIGTLEIPYGRSRPIDFDTSHFYAQHMTQQELTDFLLCEELEKHSLRDSSIFQV